MFRIEIGDLPTRTKAVMGGLVVSLGILIYTAMAVDQPVLTIAPLGTNQFSIVITNGASTTNYTLLWTPALDDANYPWVVLGAGGVGQTNFTVDGGVWPLGFFEVLVGGDSDLDGVPEWIDGQPSNPNVGALTVTIDSPLNGATFQ